MRVVLVASRGITESTFGNLPAMKNNSPDPAKSRKHLVDSLAAFSRAGGHCAFYWLSWETLKEMEAIGKDAGLTWSHFIPEAVRDPIRPTFGE